MGPRGGADDRSLSPKCTPLKQQYDSCFNAWFEGYLQPALDSSPRRPAVSTPSPSVDDNSQPSASTSLPGPTPRIATSWADAFRSKTITQISPDPVTPSPALPGVPLHPVHTSSPPVVDAKGKTRAQLKAEEYERNCGQVWREYHQCLTVRNTCTRTGNTERQHAIGENQSLSTLLEQARDEHPLGSLASVKGSIWDVDAKVET